MSKATQQPKRKSLDINFDDDAADNQKKDAAEEQMAEPQEAEPPIDIPETLGEPDKGDVEPESSSQRTTLYDFL